MDQIERFRENGLIKRYHEHPRTVRGGHTMYTRNEHLDDHGFATWLIENQKARAISEGTAGTLGTRQYAMRASAQKLAFLQQIHVCCMNLTVGRGDGLARFQELHANQLMKDTMPSHWNPQQWLKYKMTNARRLNDT